MTIAIIDTAELIEPAVLALLKEGPATLAHVSRRTDSSAIDVLQILRRLAVSKEVLAERPTVGPRKLPPLYWHLPGQKPPRTLLTAPTERRAQPGDVAVELLGVHEKHPPRTPLEVLARLAGCGAFPDLSGARGTGPSRTTDEVDFVLALAPDKLGREMARAIACRSVRPWPDVLALGAPRMLDSVAGAQRLAELVRGPYRARVRFVLHDVFHDLAQWRRARARKSAAKLCKMREDHYTRLYLHIERELLAAAEEAASNAVLRLRTNREPEDFDTYWEYEDEC